MTNNTTEISKIFSAIGFLGFSGAGIASIFSAGMVPLVGGSIALVLAGASVANLAALDKIGDRDSKLDELASANEQLAKAASDLRLQLEQVGNERDLLAKKLAIEVADFKVRCQELRDGIEFWETGMHPSLLELPPVAELVGGLRGKLALASEQLKSALAEIQRLSQENKFLTEKVAELESVNDEIDGELASKILELDKLKTNFDYKLRDELHRQLQPYCAQAVTTALEKKLAEIEKLRQAINIQQEDLASYKNLVNGLEETTLPEIETTYNSEMSARDNQLMQLSGENQLLQQQIAQLQSPRQFPGLTYADTAGNRIVGHFAAHGVIFDAHDASVIPGGYLVRFRVDRNQDKTKLSGEEFDKLTNQCGLLGLSTQPIHFKLDPLNFLISVEIFSGIASQVPDLAGKSGTGNPDLRTQSLSTIGGQLTGNLDAVNGRKKQAQKDFGNSQVRVVEPDLHRQKFVDLGCYPADQFSEVIRTKFVTRVRVCAGSTGGKSPLLEMISVELAKANNGIIWLLNPIPGSEKDWFKIPGIIQPGTDANEKIVDVFEEFHSEFQSRRNNLPSVKGKDFLLLAVDEDNATAREYEQIGTFIKDMYQLSDHVNMGFVSAGQGNNVSGLSGGNAAKKGKSEEEDGKKRTGNATRLMKEDFQNAVRVYTSEQAFSYLQVTASKNRAEMLEKLAELNQLCDRLNELEGLKVRPAVGEAKKVSPNAYRVALAVSPACEPFFFQIPAYSDFSLEGLRFPAEARVTSPHWENKSVSNVDAQCCPHCKSAIVFLKKPYANGDLRFECGNRIECRKTFRVAPANIG